MTTTIKTTTKALHEALICKLSSDDFTSGTYNLNTLETVEFSRGYQVSFCCIGDNYTDEEYGFINAMFAELSSDGIAYAGKFEGTPEVSYHISNKKTAIRLAKKFNQISIWDWKNGDTIETGGTGIR